MATQKPSDLDDLVARALAEDLGSGDLTGDAVVPEGTLGRARILQKQPGVLYGFEAAETVFRRLDPGVEWQSLAREGEWHSELPLVAAELRGDARALLAGERVALNLLQHLSGIATATAQAVEAIAGTGVTLLDTRKTIPGLRRLEKQAVVAGGGSNHRLGLYDAILVKNNHVALAGGVGPATRRAVENCPAGVTVEVEVRTLEEVEEALAAGAGRLLLDNMGPDRLREAVTLVAGRAELEASGGITTATIRAVAETGVQFVSMGSLTHSAQALDLSMSIEPAQG